MDTAPRAAEKMTAEELARTCADIMWAADEATRNLGMTLERVGPGTATVTMTITDKMVNGHDTCHGGYIFTLADSAFAFACNTYNQVTVAQHCSISFLAPGRKGDVLTARAEEVTRAGRNGIYDISVDNQDGLRIAEFRGHSRAVKGTFLP